MTILRCSLVALILSVAASAQYPIGAAAFQWSGASGSAGGTFCWGFDGVPDPVTVTANEAVTMTVRGNAAAPWALVSGPSATSTTVFPGVLNALLLDGPLFLLYVGQMNQVSAILSCPAWFDTLNVTFPAAPIGTTFALQVFTYGEGGLPAFTEAVVVTVI